MFQKVIKLKKINIESREIKIEENQLQTDEKGLIETRSEDQIWLDKYWKIIIDTFTDERIFGFTKDPTIFVWYSESLHIVLKPEKEQICIQTNNKLRTDNFHKSFDIRNFKEWKKFFAYIIHIQMEGLIL